MTRARLKQIPMFVPVDLAPIVAALPVELRALARALHQLVLDDDRTWLEVTAAAAAAEGAQLEDVLGGDRHKRPKTARHQAWWEIWEGSNGRASFAGIGRAFEVHHTTVMSAVEKYAARRAAAAAAIAAVEAHQVEQDLAAGERAA